MSRGDAFDAFYRDSRERLLHQVFAYTGDPDVAKRALAEGYVSAAQHWNKASTDPEAWVRSRAFRASARRRNRSHEPWYQSARRISDDHRPLLAALARLTPQDRHLLVARHLAGLDASSAAREVGLTESAAAVGAEQAARSLEEAGVVPAGVPAALAGLRTDLPRERVNQAARFRARGNRRRRESLLLIAGVALLAIAIGAGSISAARRTAASAPPPPPNTTTNAPSTTPAPGPPKSQVRRADLVRVPQVSLLDRSSTWSLGSTSSDFGDAKPADVCLDAAPTSATAAHYWVRTITSRLIAVTVTQSIEVASSDSKAAAAYASQVRQFGTCAPGSHRVLAVQRVQGLGDQATVLSLQYADSNGVHTKQVAIARSGTAVSTFVAVKADTQPLRNARLVRVLGASVDKVCGDSGGACATPPYRSAAEVPPPDPVAPGFLSTVDLPLFPGLSEPWVATRPAATTTNPAATECDRADFTGAGAADVTARSYVISAAGQLPAIFGMTETLGTFPSVSAAKSFVADVATSVAGCANRQLTLGVSDTAQVASSFGHGFVWRISLQTSQSTTVVFRVALVRSASTVAEATFTPSGVYDVTPDGFLSIADRAAERLSQR
jgi:DNA-directed RNA polymerase specialized sigma24 family protein